jgi:hypothetical protein
VVAEEEKASVGAAAEETSVESGDEETDMDFRVLG